MLKSSKWFKLFSKSTIQVRQSADCCNSKKGGKKNENKNETLFDSFLPLVINQKCIRKKRDSNGFEDDAERALEMLLMMMTREWDKCHKSVFWSRERHQENNTWAPMEDIISSFELFLFISFNLFSARRAILFWGSCLEQKASNLTTSKIMLNRAADSTKITLFVIFLVLCSAVY